MKTISKEIPASDSLEDNRKASLSAQKFEVLPRSRFPDQATQEI